MPKALQHADQRFRIGRFCAPLAALSLVACIGGPHPLPPGKSAENDSAPGPVVPGVGAAPMSPVTAVAGTGASAPTMTPAPMMPPAANGGAAGMAAPPVGAAAGSGTTGMGASPTSPPQQPAAAAGSGGSASGAEPPPIDAGVCDGATSALVLPPETPRNLLFVMDRSLEMAGEFEGSPRWQVAAHALSDALGPRASELTLGALLYPSASRCDAPGWLCSLQPQAMCEVTPMASADQVPFQPAPRALAALLDVAGLYAPVMVQGGVPLVESLARADAALASGAPDGKTTVVILASGTPSCGWNESTASATIARWRERGVLTHVVALPGSPAATLGALASLAEAGGTGQVHAPGAVGALEATLQSIVFDSLSSCTLQLDPPAPDPSAVQVLVTEAGVERLLPRTSSSGETLWTINADGTTVTLAGSACAAARGGTYEAVRIVLGCAR